MFFAFNFNNCTLTSREKCHRSVPSIFPWSYWTSHSCILLFIPFICLQSYSHYPHRYVLLKIFTNDNSLGCLIQVKGSWMWIQGREGLALNVTIHMIHGTFFFCGLNVDDEHQVWHSMLYGFSLKFCLAFGDCFVPSGKKEGGREMSFMLHLCGSMVLW